MYTREILPFIPSPIIDGNPVVGTWDRAFEKVDLLEIRKPYGYPLPRWVRDYRIKEWQSFSAYNDTYLLEAIFCNVKLFRMAQIILLDKKNHEIFIYRKIKPCIGWQLPVSLSNSSIDSLCSRFYFRIHTWLDADTVNLDINIEPEDKNPPLTVHLGYNLSAKDVTPMAVSLGFSQHRIMYAYKALAPVRGDIVLEGKHLNIKQDSCSGVFCDYKGFFPYQMSTTICTAVGFDEENRRFGFHIAENQTKEKNKNNENALWLNGVLTPLPPVLITVDKNPDESWVIQDVEGMVDLTFTLKEHNKSVIKNIITRADFNAPLGYYNGVLVSSSGDKILIKNVLGMGKKLYLRV